MSGNPNYPIVCPIWGTIAVQPRPAGDGRTFYDSPRAGGKFSMSGVTESDINDIRAEGLEARSINMNPRRMLMEIDVTVKARLTSWLIEQRRIGNQCPEITESVIKLAKQGKDMTIPDRADAILRYAESKTKKLGEALIYDRNNPIEEYSQIFSNAEAQPSFQELVSEWKINYYELIAFSECIDIDELISLMEYLKRRGWIECRQNFGSDGHYTCSLTVEGYTRLAEIQKNRIDPSRGFMAMWFNSSMDEAWGKGFEPGIREAGYEPIAH